MGCVNIISHTGFGSSHHAMFGKKKKLRLLGLKILIPRHPPEEVVSCGNIKKTSHLRSGS